MIERTRCVLVTALRGRIELNLWLPQLKLLREPKTATARCGVPEKPAFRAGTGLQNRCLERKSQETNPTHHEHDGNWEIAV